MIPSIRVLLVSSTKEFDKFESMANDSILLHKIQNKIEIMPMEECMY